MINVSTKDVEEANENERMIVGTSVVETVHYGLGIQLTKEPDFVKPLEHPCYHHLSEFLLVHPSGQTSHNLSQPAPA